MTALSETGTVLANQRANEAASPSSRNLLLALNALGGGAVLWSYVVGLMGDSSVGNALWGGVPETLRPLYTVNMFLAAAES